MKIILIVSCLVFLIAVVQNETLGPGDKKKKTDKKTAASKSTAAKMADVDVKKRKLVKSNQVSVDEIVNNHEKYCAKCVAEKNFNGLVLGYVTPWNSKGYDVSKTFVRKLDYISPVWLQVKRTGKKKYQLTGTHDIDSGWMDQVRAAGGNDTNPFMPRILFEKLKMEDLHALFNEEQEINALCDMLLAKSNKYNFNGYVLEIYLQLGGHGKAEINHLIVDLAAKLQSSGKKLIVVVPPPLKNVADKDAASKAPFTKEDFDTLKDIVDGFSLMTYDYASHNAQLAPNAPIDWVEANVLYLADESERKYRAKILLGLNFYGAKYELYQNAPKSAPEPILGRQLVELLRDNADIVNIKYDEKSGEHFYLLSTTEMNKIVIFYPSLYSIEKRIEMARKLGTGLSIWELGQGLDYFYDLL